MSELISVWSLKNAVIYARVSSKEQECEGYSIDAQLKLLRDFAASNGLEVVKEYQEAESAKGEGRRGFNEMVPPVLEIKVGDKAKQP